MKHVNMSLIRNFQPILPAVTYWYPMCQSVTITIWDLYNTIYGTE